MAKFFKSNSFFFLLLFLVVFAVYGKAINFGVTNIDDDTFISRKAKQLSSLKNIPNCFLKDCYLEKKTQYYRPILTVSFSIEHILFGERLKVFHLTNILLYFFALFVIYIFLSKLNFNNAILKFLVLIFTVHPVLSSVPVWIPARNDTLLTIFFLSSLINFIEYTKTDKNRYLLLHLFFFALALFSKETTVLLILTYPLLIYCFDLKVNKKQIIYNSIFIFLLLLVYFILRNYAVQPINYSTYLERYSYFINNIIVGIMLYIEKLLYPTGMPIMLYDIKPTIQTYIINILVFTFLIYVFLKQKISRKHLAFAVLFSFLAIFPTFAQEEYAFLTHRLVISLLGIFIIIISIIEKIINKNPKTEKYFVLIFVFLFLLFSFCSFLQVDKYSDSFTYLTNAYNDAPNYHCTSSLLSREFAKQQQFDKATDLALNAINLKPSFDNYLNYATILFKKKDYIFSKDIFFQLLQIDKRNFLIYQFLSNIYLFEKNFSKAIDYAKEAVEISSQDAIDKKISTFENLARIYAVSQNFQEAINILKKILQLDTKNPRYYDILSSLYEDLGDYNNSIIYIRKAVELEPSNEEYTKQLANIENKLLTEH